MTDRTGEGPHEDPNDRPDTDQLGDPSDVANDRPSGTTGDTDLEDKRGETADTGEKPSGVLGWIQWFLTTEKSPHIYVRDILSSIIIVAVIGTVLFGISGVWPPMVAITSGSMEPNMHEGDLVFIIDNERFVPDEAIEVDGVSTGVIPGDVAERNGETTYNGYGDVIVFYPNGNTGDTPIIHRAMFWVDDGEDWYDRADSTAIGNADGCEQLRHCPAPNAGFITKGDWNTNYDQATQRSAPIHPTWIIGTAELRVPYLGYIRLLFSGVAVTPETTTVSANPEAEYTTGAAERNDETVSTTAIAPASANRSPA